MQSHEATAVPNNIVVKKLPARWARGARKPRTFALGGAQTTSAIVARTDRRALLAYAARGR